MKRQKVFEESVCLKCPGLVPEWGVDTWLGQGQGPHWIIHFRLILLPGPSTTTQQYINSHDFVLNYEWGLSPPQPRSKNDESISTFSAELFSFLQLFVVFNISHSSHEWALVSSENCEPSSSAPRLTKLLSNTRRIHKLFLFSSQTASDYSQSQSPLPPWAHLAAVNNRVPYNNAVWKYRCTIFGEGTM